MVLMVAVPVMSVKMIVAVVLLLFLLMVFVSMVLGKGQEIVLVGLMGS